MKSFIIGMYGLTLVLQGTNYADSVTAGFSAVMESMEIPTIQCEEYLIPEYSGFKSFMSYKTFGKKSNQYKLQQLATTDENGFRRVNDYYIIAIGSFFEAKVGQRVNLVLENGEVIKCVVGDEKAAKDTDPSNIFSRNNCMSEFVVDLKALENTVKSRGDVSFFPDEEWDSPVVKVILFEEYMEDVWQSQDLKELKK